MSTNRTNSKDEKRLVYGAKIPDSTLPYVVVPLDGINGGKVPFKDVLKERQSKSGKKTLFNTFLYCFSCSGDGTLYFKVGNSYDANTYNSKNRFTP